MKTKKTKHQHKKPELLSYRQHKTQHSVTCHRVMITTCVGKLSKQFTANFSTVDTKFQTSSN